MSDSRRLVPVPTNHTPTPTGPESDELEKSIKRHPAGKRRKPIVKLRDELLTIVRDQP